MEFRLLGAAAGGFAAAWGSLALIHRADPAVRRSSSDLLVTGVIAGLIIGRLWAMIATGTNPLAHPADILIVRGGVDTIAAATTAVLVCGWFSRAALWPGLDALAPGAMFGLAGWHAGCLLRDACLGSPTGLPWGWSATPGGVDRHPVELYAALLLIAAGLAVLRLWRRHPGTGAATLAALMTAASTRAITEPMRPVLGAGLTASYVVVLGIVVFAGFGVWWQRYRRRQV